MVFTPGSTKDTLRPSHRNSWNAASELTISSFVVTSILVEPLKADG